jgi:hypothetical protein
LKKPETEKNKQFNFPLPFLNKNPKLQIYIHLLVEVQQFYYRPYCSPACDLRENTFLKAMGCTNSKGVAEKQPAASNPPPRGPHNTSSTPDGKNNKGESKQQLPAATISEEVSTRSPQPTSSSVIVSDGTAVFAEDPSTNNDTTTATSRKHSVDHPPPASVPKPSAQTAPVVGQSEKDKFQDAVDAIDMSMTTTMSSTTGVATVSVVAADAAEHEDVPFSPSPPPRTKSGGDEAAGGVSSASSPKVATGKRVPRSPLAAARRLNGKPHDPSSNSLTPDRRGSNAEVEGSQSRSHKRRTKHHNAAGGGGDAFGGTHADAYLEMVSAYEKQLTSPIGQSSPPFNN